MCQRWGSLTVLVLVEDVDLVELEEGPELHAELADERDVRLLQEDLLAAAHDVEDLALHLGGVESVDLALDPLPKERAHQVQLRVVELVELGEHLAFVVGLAQLQAEEELAVLRVEHGLEDVHLPVDADLHVPPLLGHRLLAHDGRVVRRPVKSQDRVVHVLDLDLPQLVRPVPPLQDVP